MSLGIFKDIYVQYNIYSAKGPNPLLHADVARVVENRYS